MSVKIVPFCAQIAAGQNAVINGNCENIHSKYSIFNRGKVVSKNNVVDIKFPSEIYDFDKTLEKDLKKKLKRSNLQLNYLNQ